MTVYFKEERIDLGDQVLNSGHNVYTNSRYEIGKGEFVSVIYKKNKYKNPELSLFETAFGEIARLFLPLNLTAKQVLVKDEAKNIVGICAERITYPITQREGLSSPFFSFDSKEEGIRLTPVHAKNSNEIPFYFLKEFPSGFFSKMKTACDQGKLSLNMESLAGVLATSYTLEEDDLHKGNFGFYIVEKGGIPEVVFFKIDHDLMLADSVMSYCNARFFNWFNGTDAFKVTAKDLLNFPALQDSKNYYWPTRERSLSAIRPYAYTSSEETEAFASLAQSQIFIKEKWKAFYKHILIPPAIIKESLSKQFNCNNPDERAKVALITQSIVARQAKLRAVLFTLPEFRRFVRELSEEELASIKHTIVPFTSSASTEVEKRMIEYAALCRSGVFKKGDTPLHAAIRLGDFRYHETVLAFNEFMNTKNAWGQTPLDLAVFNYQQKKKEKDNDIRSSLPCIIKFLVQNGGEKTHAFFRFIKAVHYDADLFLFSTGYPTRALQAKNSQELREVLRDIGEDHRYCLKMQKQIAVICIRKFIEANKKNMYLKKELMNLKRALNGDGEQMPAPELNYIRQLRSQLWIIRILRGLFGYTTTKAEINSLLDRGIKETSDLCCSEQSIFKHTTSKPETFISQTLTKCL
ncbi:ankyrin (plasmid) [Legionella adelaidensis]|uniref:Ankyrin n=1 Tax=Legionella adelaidensis TaxID=45056 RepID=A0A0W0R399_9GAMM|nr:Dot/Icm T4SS effector AnkK/LegA5 [Legionella adelaidensis]KTC65541.1 cardiac ankyrin repeat-containing protein [Legionella adelaidensis]VEH84638.1 ankyrin [Legionella adelaidensis]